MRTITFSLFCQHQPPTSLPHTLLVVLAVTLPLLLTSPASAGNLVLSASGGTFKMGTVVGSTVSLTGATTTSPAGSISLSCTVSSIGGSYPVVYACTGGSFTFTSNDGSTTVSGTFNTPAAVDEWIYGGGRGGQTHYSYEF